MTITLHHPGTEEIGEALASLRDWQHDEPAVHLHPGDVGWFWRFGTDATVAAIRTWSRGGRMLAVGLLDSPDVLRLTIAPDARRDEELAHALAADFADADRGILPEGTVSVEAPMDSLLQDVLAESGWQPDEPWTALRLDLSEPVPDPGVRIELVGVERGGEWATAQRSAFEHSTFTEERWVAMSQGRPFEDARFLLAYNDDGDAVANIGVWSAGTGRPGLIEPMGVHRDHRRQGLGRAMTLAGAAVLRELGASSAIVSTPSSNAAAVATYVSAGFEALPEVRDIQRPAREDGVSPQ